MAGDNDKGLYFAGGMITMAGLVALFSGRGSSSNDEDPDEGEDDYEEDEDDDYDLDEDEDGEDVELPEVMRYHFDEALERLVEVANVLEAAAEEAASLYFSGERDLHEWLHDYLDGAFTCDVEKNPLTSVHKPDILVDGLIAIELKSNLNAAEQDRLGGQVEKYSRKYPTFVVLHATRASRAREFSTFLERTGLGYVFVQDF